jgi:hypothetical protein
MRIEVREGIVVEGFKLKDEYQAEIIRIIFEDNKKLFSIIYCGLAEDVSWKNKKCAFWSDYKYRKNPDRFSIVKKWNALMELMDNPKFVIIFWMRKTEKSVYFKKPEKMKKDGTPRINPNWKKIKNKDIQ